ncbi:hypothetical protein [Anabaena azotica]|uniref:hypothetical protein n=1 Tax=Anabaena azotica TaxID=197653 RepID=UPI0039A5530E
MKFKIIDIQEDANLNCYSVGKFEEIWENQSIDKLLQQQSIPIITNIQSLTVNFWQKDETNDEFEDFIKDGR